MIGLLLLGFVIVGGFWLLLAMIGLVFKLVFSIVGGMFSLFGGLIAMGVAGLLGVVLLPIFGLLMLPPLTPLLFIGFVIWLLTRHSRRPVVYVQAR